MITIEGKEYTEQEALQYFMHFKNEENKAKEKRGIFEAALIEHFGAESTKVDRYKISFKKNYKYSLKQKGWEEIYKIPQELRPLKIDLDITKVKKLPKIAMYLEITQNKPTVTVCYE